MLVFKLDRPVAAVDRLQLAETTKFVPRSDGSKQDTPGAVEGLRWIRLLAFCAIDPVDEEVPMIRPSAGSAFNKASKPGAVDGRLQKEEVGSGGSELLEVASLLLVEDGLHVLAGIKLCKEDCLSLGICRGGPTRRATLACTGLKGTGPASAALAVCWALRQCASATQVPPETQAGRSGACLKPASRSGIPGWGEANCRRPPPASAGARGCPRASPSSPPPCLVGGSAWVALSEPCSTRVDGVTKWPTLLYPALLHPTLLYPTLPYPTVSHSKPRCRYCTSTARLGFGHTMLIGYLHPPPCRFLLTKPVGMSHPPRPLTGQLPFTKLAMLGGFPRTFRPFFPYETFGGRARVRGSPVPLFPPVLMEGN